jgi:hypothetical protein
MRDTLPHPLHFYLQAKKEELGRSDHGFCSCPWSGPLTTLVPLTIQVMHYRKRVRERAFQPPQCYGLSNGKDLVRTVGRMSWELA